jgi:hypothetical protein
MTNAEHIARLLDLFYEKDGQEPDWSAIATEIHTIPFQDAALLDILKAFHSVYEIDDFAVIKTNIFVLTGDVP